MNEKFENKHRNGDDDARFERLADGELSAEEYRALVAALDDEPGGWRKCALAFLESQALGVELRSVASCVATQVSPPPSPRGEARHTKRGWSVGPFELKTLLAMAASFLVAFGLGVVLPRWPLARSTTPTVAALPGTISAPVSNAIRPGIGNANLRHDMYKPVANVRLVVDGPAGDSTPVGELPLYEVSGPVEEWLAGEAPALPRELLQSLEERGHQIKRHIQYVPVQLEDGRQGIVPVENYQITPVGQRAY